MWTGNVNHGLLILATALLFPTVALEAQQSESPLEENARLQRRGAGLRLGAWDVRGLQESSEVSYARTPIIEGYFRKGLDRHLALETSITVWRRSQEATSTGITGSSTESIDSYIVPMFTALKLFPFTGPEARFEPYFDGGIGLALGIDDRNVTGSGPFGGAGSGPGVATGFGFRGGAGVEWRFSRAFGLGGGARYQWVRFTADVGGERTYRGLAADGGLTYRFQF